MAEWKTAGKVRMTPRGTHDSSLAYEILDVVTNSTDNKVYVAKVDVPAGVALTNTTYWVNIIDVSNAYVAIGDSIATLSEAKTYLDIT